MDTDQDWFFKPEDDDVTSNVSDLTQCTDYQEGKYRILAIVAASMGAVSLVASLAVILFIILLKKYHNFVQRLILYLSIVIAINAVSVTLRYSRATHKNYKGGYLEYWCIAAAFLDQTTRWSMTIAYACLTFTLLIATVFHSSGEKLEKGYILAIFVSPLLFNWIPLIKETYGEAGPWCWIKTENYEYDSKGNITSCTPHTLGVFLKYALWYIPNYVILFILLVVYVVVVIKLVRDNRHWKGIFSTATEHKENHKLNQLVMTIILYPLVLFILSFFPLLNRVYLSKHDPNYYLWLLHSIFSPLQGGFVAVVYALDIDTIKRLSAKECFAHLFHRKTDVREYPAGLGRTDSLTKLTTEDCTDYLVVSYGSTSKTQQSGLQPNSGGETLGFERSVDARKLEASSGKDEMKLQKNPAGQLSPPVPHHNKCSDIKL